MRHPIRQPFVVKVVELECYLGSNTARHTTESGTFSPSTHVSRNLSESGVVCFYKTYCRNRRCAETVWSLISQCHDLIVEIRCSKTDLRTARRQTSKQMPRYVVKRG